VTYFAQSEVVKLIIKSLEDTRVFTNCSKIRGLVHLKVMIYMPFQTHMIGFLLNVKNVY